MEGVYHKQSALQEMSEEVLSELGNAIKWKPGLAEKNTENWK